MPPSCKDAALITRLVEGYNAGDDLYKLAAENGITYQYIYMLTRDDHRRITPAQRSEVRRRKRGAEMLKLYRSGKTIREIAQTTGKSFGCVRSTLTLLGAQMRPVGWAGCRATQAIREASARHCAADPETSR